MFSDSQSVLQTQVAVGNSVFPSRYTDANPFKLLTVDPDTIEYLISDTTVPMRYGRTMAGDWDLKREPIAENVVYRSFSSRFLEGASWSDTALYRKHRSKIRSGSTIKGYRSMSGLKNWYRQMDRLYERITNDGYRTQRELLEANPEQTRQRCNDAITPERNEVGVNIGRNGEFIWRHRGKHRLFIAKIANVETIPVHVLTRHRQWQRYRYEVAKNPEMKMVHPDLEDIVPERVTA